MQVAVIGTGNVGSALLIHLQEISEIDEILVMNLKDEWSNAAIMDAAGANPEAALKLAIAPFSRLGQSDILVLTSGVQMKAGETPKDVLRNNIDVTNSILDSAVIKKSAIVIALATPVDDITAHIQIKYGLPENQVFGFGGDIDRNRLIYVLKKNGLPAENAEIVGEHMKRTIPVYKGEEKYTEVANNVRNFLANITAQGGAPRNLATGLLLSRLVESVVTDANRVHYVCGYHPDYELYITWPFYLGRRGVIKPKPVFPGTNAEKELESLVEVKRKELSEL